MDHSELQIQAGPVVLKSGFLRAEVTNTFHNDRTCVIAKPCVRHLNSETPKWFISYDQLKKAHKRLCVSSSCLCGRPPYEGINLNGYRSDERTDGSGIVVYVDTRSMEY